MISEQEFFTKLESGEIQGAVLSHGEDENHDEYVWHANYNGWGCGYVVNGSFSRAICPPIPQENGILKGTVANNFSISTNKTKEGAKMLIEKNGITFTIIKEKEYDKLKSQSRVRRHERGYEEARIELNVGWLPIHVDGRELPKVTPLPETTPLELAGFVRRRHDDLYKDHC